MLISISESNSNSNSNSSITATNTSDSSRTNKIISRCITLVTSQTDVNIYSRETIWRFIVQLSSTYTLINKIVFEKINSWFVNTLISSKGDEEIQAITYALIYSLYPLKDLIDGCGASCPWLDNNNNNNNMQGVVVGNNNNNNNYNVQNSGMNKTQLLNTIIYSPRDASRLPILSEEIKILINDQNVKSIRSSILWKLLLSNLPIASREHQSCKQSQTYTFPDSSSPRGFIFFYLRIFRQYITENNLFDSLVNELQPILILNKSLIHDSGPCNQTRSELILLLSEIVLQSKVCFQKIITDHKSWLESFLDCGITKSQDKVLIYHNEIVLPSLYKMYKYLCSNVNWFPSVIIEHQTFVWAMKEILFGTIVHPKTNQSIVDVCAVISLNPKLSKHFANEYYHSIYPTRANVQSPLSHLKFWNVVLAPSEDSRLNFVQKGGFVDLVQKCQLFQKAINSQNDFSQFEEDISEYCKLVELLIDFSKSPKGLKADYSQVQFKNLSSHLISVQRFGFPPIIRISASKLLLKIWGYSPIIRDNHFSEFITNLLSSELEETRLDTDVAISPGINPSYTKPLTPTLLKLVYEMCLLSSPSTTTATATTTTTTAPNNTNNTSNSSSVNGNENAQIINWVKLLVFLLFETCQQNVEFPDLHKNVVKLLLPIAQGGSNISPAQSRAAVCLIQNNLLSSYARKIIQDRCDTFGDSSEIEFFRLISPKILSVEELGTATVQEIEKLNNFVNNIKNIIQSTLVVTDVNAQNEINLFLTAILRSLRKLVALPTDVSINRSQIIQSVEQILVDQQVNSFPIVSEINSIIILLKKKRDSKEK